MAQSNDPPLGINSWLEDELYHQYQFDKKSVDEGWTEFFQHPGQNGGTQTARQTQPDSSGVAVAEPPPPPPPEPAAKPITQVQDAVAKAQSNAVATAPKAPAKQEPVQTGPGEQLVPLRGAAARIAENMALSLAIPVATSQRQIPTRVIEENRNLINKQRALQAKSKLSFTHIIAWAIVKAIKSNPSLNHAFDEKDGQPFRVVRTNVNIGLAVDVPGKDGTRSLLVPNIKNADELNFAQFAAAYDEIVSRARNNKLQVSDFKEQPYR